MNLVGEHVSHVSFGEGVVLKIEKGIVTIQFSDSVGQKKFQYPLAFEHFLKMSNCMAQKYVDEELLGLRNAMEAERIQREELRLKEEEQRLAAKLTLKKTAPKKSKTTTKSKGASKSLSK